MGTFSSLHAEIAIILSSYAGVILTSYDITASDLGTAINVAHRRAFNDGYVHTSIVGTQQTGATSWTITMFVSQ